MMRKVFLSSLVVLTAVLLFTQIPSAEAKTRVQVGIGNCFGGCRDAYVVRRYTPVIVAAPAPVYAVPPGYYPAPYPAPVYVYPAPAYVEEVRVVQPRCRPFGFAGLSFSWNLFR